MGDMLVPLYKLPEKVPYQNGDIVIRRAIAPEKHVVINWVKEHFNQRWADECEVAFSRQPVSCFIATENNKMLGFACYEATYRNFFGPTGVDEAARGKGIGKALLLESLHAMYAEGYAYAIIGGAGPTKFYEKTVNAIEIPDSKPGIYKGML